MLSTLVAASFLCAADVRATSDVWLDSPRVVSLDDARSLESQRLLQHAYVSSIEPRRGVPSFLWAEQLHTPLARLGLSADEAARRYLLAWASAYRLDAETVSRLTVTRVHAVGKGAVVVGFVRETDAVPFFRDELHVVMTADYELVAFSGSLATQTPKTRTFRLGADAALSVAAQSLTGLVLDASKFPLTRFTPGGWQRHDGAGLLHSAPRARKVFFDTGDEVVPAWQLELETDSLFSVVVSAVDGRLLSRASLSWDVATTYRVFAQGQAPFRTLDSPIGDGALPHPTGVPDGFAPLNLPSALVTLDHGGLSTGDPWRLANDTELSGNNVNAYADLARPDGLDAGDVTVPLSSPNTFDYAYDFASLSDAGVTQHQAAAVQAFFLTNHLHDVFYDLGFDEAAGNAQRSNFGRGGLEGDALNVEVHDFSSALRNNARLTAHLDGEAPVLELGVFDVPRPSTLTAVTADGGLFAGSPNLVERAAGWNVTGPLAVPVDTDGGFAGCDPFVVDSGVVLLLEPAGCALASRLDAARDAGVSAVVLNGCVGVVDPSLVVTCLDVDAGTQLRAVALAGNAVDVTLARPPMTRELDSAFDTSVVTHEFTHLVSSRVVGQGAGLINSPGRAIAEGWSDFFALWNALDAADAQRVGNDQWQGTFAIGGYLSQGQGFDGAPLPGYYFGRRRYPYSSDRTKNPLTFKHVGLNVPLPATSVAPRQDGDPNNAEVHNAGEVWAAMWWDAQVKLLTRQGATFTQAHDAMGAYFVAALAATPAVPTFLEARDALLAVVYASSPTVDFPLVQSAFASRGLGMLAQSSDRRSSTNTPLAEDFTGVGGNYKVVELSIDDTDGDCDSDGVLDSAETGTLTLKLMNVGSKRLSQSSLRLSSALPQLQLAATAQPVPASNPFEVVTVTMPVSMGLIAGTQRTTVTVQVTDPNLVLLQNRFEATLDVRLNTDRITSNTEDFESNPDGWSFGADSVFSLEDTWLVKAQTAANVNRVLSGPDPRRAGETWVTSAPIAVGAMDFSVTFSQTYAFENATTFFDGGRLELSTDGVTFTPVPGSSLSPTYTGTLKADSDNPLAGAAAFVGVNTMKHDVTASFGTTYANRTVWLRWRIAADSSGGAPGWTVDDVRVTGATTPPFHQVVDHRSLSCVNHPPTIAGTSSLNTDEGELVTLVEGTTFDRDLDPLVVTWMQTSGPTVQLVNGKTFEAPPVSPQGAVLGFRVTVADDRGGSDFDDMTVTVRNVNQAPRITDTDGPQEVTAGDTVTFGVTAEDVDGDTLSYQWLEEGESTVTLGDATQTTLTFTAPDVKVDSQLSFKVVALDGRKASEPAYLALVVKAKAQGCTCTSVEPLFVFAALAWLTRRRRSRR